MTYYRINYEADASQGAWVRAHEESLVALGMLVPVTIDYEAAHEHAQEFVANLSVDDIHGIVDAAEFFVSVTIDPEDVLEDWLIDHGVDKENAYNIGHHLTHSVLYSVARAVKRARADGWEAAMSQENTPDAALGDNDDTTD